MNTIVVAGHICLDITPGFESKNRMDLHSLLDPGKLIEVKKADVSVGGAVSNTGLALKKLGCDTCLMGIIGNDIFGKIVYELYKKYDAQEYVLVSDETTTSYTVVLAVPGYDRIFLHNPGANDYFDAQILDYEKIRQAKLFHFGYPPLMRKMYQENGANLTSIFQKIQGMGVMTSLDMASVDETTDAGKADWKQILENVLKYVDYFVPSYDEIAYMLNMKDADCAAIADVLLSLGAKNIMIKCGEKGIYFKNDREEIFQTCFTPDRIRSATGAGDTSIAAFLKAVCEGYGHELALKFAAATGACCVEEYDAISGIIDFKELRKKFHF